MRRKPASPTVVLLVRHGLTPTTGKDMPDAGPGLSLSQDGRRQVEETAQHILDVRPHLPALSALYTSPLARTRETAAIIAKALDLTAVEKPALRDCEIGEWAGAPLKDLARKPEWPTVINYPSGFRFPGGETISGMQSRAVGTVRELVSAHAGSTIVVVSHSDPIKAVLADALGIHLDLFQRIVVAPASLSSVSYSQARPSVWLLNWTPAWQPRPLDRK